MAKKIADECSCNFEKREKGHSYSFRLLLEIKLLDQKKVGGVQKVGHQIQARLKSFDWISSQYTDLLVPNSEIQSWLSPIEFEEIKPISIFVVHINGKNQGASCDFRGLKIQKFWIEKLLNANSKSYVKNWLNFVDIQDSHESLDELDGPRKVEVEAQLDDYLRLQVH